MPAVHSCTEQNTPTVCSYNKIIVLGALSQESSNAAQSSTDVLGEVQGKGGGYNIMQASEQAEICVR